MLRKVRDNISYTSEIVPEVKDIWPVFQLYGKIFDECPNTEQLKDVPWAKSRRNMGIYITEGSMFYFKKRNARIIGKDMNQIDTAINTENRSFIDGIFFGINTSFNNADTKIINAIV